MGENNGGCGANSNCMNRSGVAHCHCKDGFELEGDKCVRENPCEKNNGGCDSHHSTCKWNRNTEEQICECDQGFDGDGKNCVLVEWKKIGNGACRMNGIEIEHIYKNSQGVEKCKNDCLTLGRKWCGAIDVSNDGVCALYLSERIIIPSGWQGRRPMKGPFMRTQKNESD